MYLIQRQIFHHFHFHISEYKSRFHKTVEDEHLSKHKSLCINLASYVEVCTGNSITNRGLQCLLHYRDKFKQYKLNIDLYNMVLGGFAEKANLPKIKEVLGILKTDNIDCNAQSYAAIFECLGRLDENDENLKLIRKFQEDASQNVIYFEMENTNASSSFPFLVCFCRVFH